jgi:hypothetical protein
MSLRMAGENINGEVASRLSGVNLELADRVRELNEAARSLQDVMSGQDARKEISAVTYSPDLATSLPAGSNDTWSLRLTFVFCSLGLGLVAAVIAESHHHADAAMSVGVLALAIPILGWINKALLARRASRGLN